MVSQPWVHDDQFSDHPIGFGQLLIALQSYPVESRLYRVIYNAISEKGTCALSTVELAQRTGLSPAAVAQSRYKLSCLGLLVMEFVVKDDFTRYWNLTLPKVLPSVLRGDVDLSGRLIKHVDDLVKRHKVEIDKTVMRESVYPSPLAVAIWQAILDMMDEENFMRAHRILMEGIVPITVHLGILFLKTVTEESYDFLQDFRYRALYVFIREIEYAGFVRHIDFGMNDIPVGLLRVDRKIAPGASYHNATVTVNETPICGFCGKEESQHVFHPPFQGFHPDQEDFWTQPLGSRKKPK